MTREPNLAKNTGVGAVFAVAPAVECPHESLALASPCARKSLNRIELTSAEAATSLLWSSARPVAARNERGCERPSLRAAGSAPGRNPGGSLTPRCPCPSHVVAMASTCSSPKSNALLWDWTTSALGSGPVSGFRSVHPHSKE